MTMRPKTMARNFWFGDMISSTVRNQSVMFHLESQLFVLVETLSNISRGVIEMGCKTRASDLMLVLPSCLYNCARSWLTRKGQL